MATVAVTRSISVLIAVACFGPVLFIRRKHALLTVAALLAAGSVGASVLGDRIKAAIGDADGSFTDLITSSLGSWRNIPDIAIVSNYSAFLIPGNPAEICAKIKTSVVLISPLFAWLENTYSIFAAGGVTAGPFVTVIAFIGGMAVGLRSLSSSSPARVTWIMMSRGQFGTGTIFCRKDGSRPSALWFSSCFNIVTVRRSTGVIVHSSCALALYKRNYLRHNSNVHAMPLLFDDEIGSERFLGFVGTACKSHCFDVFVYFAKYAIRSGSRMPFMIATKVDLTSLLDKDRELAGLVSEGRIRMPHGRGLSNDEINLHYLDCFCV
ncbi:MAG: hypothetical protein ABR987_18565 [Terracidiphilus sp.]|jgi:hypothetical protein